MERVVRLCALCILMFNLASKPALAQYLCKTELSYKWVPDEQDPEQVRFEIVSAEAEQEDQAKQLLKQKLSDVQIRAMQHCRAKHQNLSGCIAEKFSGLHGMMGSLSFTARKTLEDAVTLDCKKNQGRCQEPVSGKISCSLVSKGDDQLDGQEKSEKKKEKGTETK